MFCGQKQNNRRIYARKNEGLELGRIAQDSVPRVFTENQFGDTAVAQGTDGRQIIDRK